jgi:hypothetical protein
MTEKVKLTEQVSTSNTSLVVDRQNKVLRGVRILGLHSRNERTYTQECIAEACKLYEGKPGFVNHADNHSSPEKLGIHRNPRPATTGAPGLISDFYLNPHHPLTDAVLWEAEQPDSSVGFSHDCEAMVSRKDQTTVVEKIVSVASIDLVCDPATVTNMREGAEATSQTPATVTETMQQRVARYTGQTEALDVRQRWSGATHTTEELQAVVKAWKYPQ